MSAYSMLLSALRGVRRAAPRAGQVEAHRACCPVCQPEGPRQGRDPALSLSLRADETVLIYCFKSECAPAEIAQAAGLEVSDLFPPRDTAGRGHGGPGAWASAAALAERLADAAIRAAMGDPEAVWEVQRAADDFRRAAREAMRRDARAGARAGDVAQGREVAV